MCLDRITQFFAKEKIYLNTILHEGNLTTKGSDYKVSLTSINKLLNEQNLGLYYVCDEHTRNYDQFLIVLEQHFYIAEKEEDDLYISYNCPKGFVIFSFLMLSKPNNVP